MSTLQEILPDLQKYRSVLVTGPQRAGTTIAAHILAEELGLRYVDEEEFGIHDAPKAEWLMLHGAVVVQGPALSHVAHLFYDVAVVMVLRDLGEIHESEERTQWRTLYDGANVRAERAKYKAVFGEEMEDTALTKYHFWETYQRAILGDRAFELDYNSLKGHKLWLNKAERQNFTIRQWS